MAPDNPSIQEQANALLNRTKALLLTAAMQGNDELAQFARGGINALSSLGSDAASFAARKDAASAGYQPPTCLRAAWTALPVGVERLPLADVKQLLAAHLVQVAADDVSGAEVDAVEQLEHDVLALVRSDDEHAARSVDRDDGPLHSASSVVIGEGNVPPQGGAA